ncbi:MAG: hypothetical protein J6W30_01405 [Bacteroidales bacterium]|nr:hypothetical protein [Bacteroidales bacterium]
MSYLSLKLISIAVLLLLLMVILFVTHRENDETYETDEGNCEDLSVFRFRNWWQRATREECKQMLITALVRFNKYLKDEDITDYDVQDRMMRLFDRLDESQKNEIYPDASKLSGYIRGTARSFSESREMYDYFQKQYGETDLVDETKYRYIMGYSLFDDSGAIDHQNFSKLKVLLDKMRKNFKDGDLWKNIPLAKKAINLMKKRGISVENEVYKEFCETVIYEPMLDDMETPRLMLSFIEYNHKLTGSSAPWEDKEKKLNKLIDPRTTYKEICDLILEDRSLLYDPVQMTEKYEMVIYDVEKECNVMLKLEPRRMGFCHKYWSVKEKALAKHGIIWRSPSEMNPKVKFD